MGNRKDWNGEQIKSYLDRAGGNLTLAARIMSNDHKDKDRVTRQNLQTWVNDTFSGRPTEVMDGLDNFELQHKLRLAQNRNSKLGRELRNITDAYLNKNGVMSSLEEVIANYNPEPLVIDKPKVIDGRKITVELLFSDIQIGKLMDDYNTKVARKRVDEWLSVVMERLNQYAVLGYQVEKIVFAILGDIIESDKKHANSGRGCDIGTADQMKEGIELLNHCIHTLAGVGVPIDVVMITGNHDHDGHGLNMFYAGREHLSWPMYHAVRMMTEASGIDAKFYIPEGSFQIYKLYGQNVLYEHGVGVATSEAAMKKHVGNRINQQKDYIDLFRMGDKHNICRFNNDRYVVNGAFFGDSRKGEEYSGIVGYDGEPAQLMFAHVKRKDNFRTSIFDSLAIQLGHVK